MTTTTTRNLGREVAVALDWEYIEEYSYWVDDYYDIHPIDGLRGYSPNNHELTLIPDYPNDLNACTRDLVREGWEFELVTDLGQWIARYRYKGWGQLVIARASEPAVAWCEAFLALCKHVDGQGE